MRKIFYYIRSITILLYKYRYEVINKLKERKLTNFQLWTEFVGFFHYWSHFFLQMLMNVSRAFIIFNFFLNLTLYYFKFIIVPDRRNWYTLIILLGDVSKFIRSTRRNTKNKFWSIVSRRQLSSQPGAENSIPSHVLLMVTIWNSKYSSYSSDIFSDVPYRNASQRTLSLNTSIG